MISIRLVAVTDAATLSSLYEDNWPFLAPFEPDRDSDFRTPGGQLNRIEAAIAELHAGTGRRYLISDDETPVGMISLTAIQRGPAQSAHLGYWVAQAANGRGIATRATALAMEVAFGELKLHRLQAGVQLDNFGSRRVLERSGFEQIGVAREYLHIAGKWRDHLLFQRLAG